MFTWVCPDCGAEVDVAEKRCPRCKANSTEDTADELPIAKGSSDSTQFSLRPTHLALFAVALIASVALAFYLSRPRGLVLEDIPEDAIAEPTVTGGSGIAEQIEITGLRFRYDDDFTPLVQAVVINHSNSELQGVKLAVKLNTVAAPADASPLGTFEVVLDEPLGEQGSAEIEATMVMAGTLAALPPPDQLRVEVERIN